MSAQPSDGAFDVASRWQGHRFNCAIYGDHDLPDTSCTCIVRELAAAIDSHVRAEVERERERCARIADTFASVAKAEARFDAAEDARFIAEQIREGAPIP